MDDNLTINQTFARPSHSQANQQGGAARQLAIYTHIQTMLELQEAINQRIHLNWREAQNPWYRAIWVEAAEMLDHHGWKWWKKQTPDWDQIHMEIVDIWHFGLSDSLQHSEDHGLTADALYRFIAQPCDALTSKSQAFESQAVANQAVESQALLDSIENLAMDCLALKRFPLARFATLMIESNLSFDHLAKLYIGKNCLNRFRQDHGYKEGSYQKIWHGKEDNQHLADILNAISPEAPDLQTLIYTQLSQIYTKI